MEADFRPASNFDQPAKIQDPARYRTYQIQNTIGYATCPAARLGRRVKFGPIFGPILVLAIFGPVVWYSSVGPSWPQVFVNLDTVGQTKGSKCLRTVEVMVRSSRETVPHSRG